jgi:chromosome segregation ATPase
VELKRDREIESNRNYSIDTGVAFAAVHSRTAEQEKAKSDEERMSIFWRVFGGTLVSICALVAITLFNNFNSNLSELRNEINRINEARGDFVKKDEFNTRISANYERVQQLQTQNNVHNSNLTSLQTANVEMKDRVTALKVDFDTVRKDATLVAETSKKDIAATLEQVRKEQALINDGLKKDVSAIEGLKERLAAAEGMRKDLDAIKKELASLDTAKEKFALIMAELKDHRDELAKIRQESDRNFASDVERKKSRDEQYAKLLESIKDLDKAVRICSEKIARLEGSVTPAKPVASASEKKSDDE